MIQFLNLPENARIWVYTSNRIITIKEKEIILSVGYKFLSTWSAHGDKLSAGIDVLDDCFVCIGVDQSDTSASGCSIDKSITFLQQLEKDLDISLLDWQNMAYKENDKIKLIKRSQFEKALKDNSMSSTVHIFNTNLKLKSDLKENRTLPVSESSFKNLL